MNFKRFFQTSSFIEDVSIVMAVYNHEDTLSEAIESVLMQQSSHSYRIYCLNDASTDNSAKILEKYASKYPEKISVYTSTVNQGSGKKSFYHNKPTVNGRYWCFLAGDDYWTSDKKLQKQVSFLDENDDYVGCGCTTIVKNQTTGNERLINPVLKDWNIMDTMLLSKKFSFYLHTSSILWRNVFLNKGFFLPPQFRQSFAKGDVVLSRMMLSSGMKMHNINETMSCYRVTGKGVWSSLSAEEKEKTKLRLQENLKRATPLKYHFFSRLISDTELQQKPLVKWFLPHILKPING